MESHVIEPSYEDIANNTIMEVQTLHFGAVNVSFDQFVYFAEGIIGFEAFKRFAILSPFGSGSPFLWLQSMDRPDLSFVMVAPRLFNPGYQAIVSDEARAALALTEGKEAELYAIVTLPKEEPHQLWLNLRAPVILNRKDKLAVQIVIDDANHPLRHTVFVKDLSDALLKAAA